MNKITHALMSILFTPVYDIQDILVCYASQTGTAANLANQSADIIRSIGRIADVKSLALLSPNDFNHYRQVLLIVSTCGEGEIPDDGKAFYQELKNIVSINTSVSLLALGDQSYQHYCLAGKLMHSELKRIGVASEEEPTLVSGNPSTVWRKWLSKHIDNEVTEQQTKSPSPSVTLSLVSKQPLHRNSVDTNNDANQAFHLTFDLSSNDDVNYKVNDLIGITPVGSDKERLYSIASSSEITPKQLSLCVAKHQFLLDGKMTNGLCSDFLIEQLTQGQEFKAQLKSGAGMALPSPDTPCILVATGAGIAPMMAVLAEREYLKHLAKNWLIFGNRYSNNDYYYKDEIHRYLENNTLMQLDTAFSRDSEQKVYVQDLLVQHQEQLAKWLLEDNALLYVCGRPELKESILDAVRSAIKIHMATNSDAEQKLLEMVNKKQIIFELF